MALILLCSKCNRQLSPSESPVIVGDQFLGSACCGKKSGRLVAGTITINSDGDIILSVPDFLARVTPGTKFWTNTYDINKGPLTIIGPFVLKEVRLEGFTQPPKYHRILCDDCAGTNHYHPILVEDAVNQYHGVCLSLEAARIRFKQLQDNFLARKI